MLQKHCKKEHRQAWKGDTSTLYKRVKVQTFFRTGGLQRYFVVRAVDSRNALAVVSDMDGICWDGEEMKEKVVVLRELDRAIIYNE
jgi:hypothetical protein